MLYLLENDTFAQCIITTNVVNNTVPHVARNEFTNIYKQNHTTDLA